MVRDSSLGLKGERYSSSISMVLTTKCSIIMEYADSGDLFQQICDHQKNNTLFKEEDIWRMFI